MKKLLAVLPALTILTACNSAPIAKPNALQVHNVLENTKTYKCDKSTEVVAVYGDEVANLKVTSPLLSLNQTALLLKQAVSASGTRYVTETTDKSTAYEWHVKDPEGVFTVTHNGTEYQFSCQAM